MLLFKMVNDDDSKHDGWRPRWRGRRDEPTTVQAALRGGLGPLMRQFRKFNAMRAALDLLPPALAGLAVPFDVRLAPSREAGGAGDLADINTMYFYVANATVRMVLEKQKRSLLEAINGQLDFAFIEEFRFEEASPPKIERQMNILRLSPD